MESIGKRRKSHDNHIHRQRVRVKCRYGLFPLFDDGAHGRYYFEETALSAGICTGRCVCGCSIFTGPVIFVEDAGEDRGGCAAGINRIWRRASAAAADNFVFRDFLCIGRLCFGTGTVVRQQYSNGKRHFLYRCKCYGAAAFCLCGLFCVDSGISGGCTAQCSGGIDFRTALPGRKNHWADRASGQRK